MDKVLVALGIGFVFWCIGDAIVRIIRAGKGSNQSKQLETRIDDLETDLAAVEQDLEEARNRIIVLEKIITDDRGNHRKKSDDLG